jgi:hypothetical protein
VVVADTPSAAASLPWSPSNDGTLHFTGLAPGTLYRLDVRGVDSVAGVGDPITWRWRSAPCLSPSAVAAANVTISPLRPGAVLSTWTGPNNSEQLGGMEYSVDDGQWTLTSVVGSIMLTGLTYPAWHSVSVRPVAHPVCRAAAGTFAATSMSWYEFAPAPGGVTILSGPAPVSASAYAVFVVNTTAVPSAVALQCVLDGGHWTGCGRGGVVRVGPLAAGPHSLSVRPVGVVDGRAGTASLPFEWIVAPQATATVLLAQLAEGLRGHWWR